MSESAIESGGPSLEQLLWRAVDRYSEQPALIDSDEFAERIAEAFDGDVPAEAFVDRFFRGEDPLRGPASDMAEAVVRATGSRMHVYEFNLKQLEYVIIEDKDKVVVVSDFGQFAFDNDDAVTRAIEAAIVAAGAPGASVRSDGTPVRDGAEPRAYFVRSTGEMVAIDVKKVSRTLEQFFAKQVSHAAVDAPGARMMPFAPSRRRLSEEREVSVLRQDTRMRMSVPPPPPGLAASRGAWGVRARDAAQARLLAPPASAETTVFVLLPDGSLARPAIGSATRWQEMVGAWVSRAAAPGAVAGFGGIASASSTPLPLGSEQRFIVQAGNVVAIISGGERQQAGTVGERALTRGEAISQVRGDSAPIRILGDDELARAISRGAMIVPGLAPSQQGAPGDRFWIQPEIAFAPSEQQQKRAQLGFGSPQGGELVENGGRQGVASSGGEPLQLGQITGDPWADWALTGGGEEPAAAFLAARNRPRGLFRAALDRAREGSADAPPGLAQRLGIQRDLLLHGAPVIGFRAADGSLVLQRGSGPIRLAALDRPEGSFEPAAPRSGGSRGQALAFRAGALPASALAILRVALEQTARAGGYKLPAVRLDSADLTEALQAYLGAQVVPVGQGGEWTPGPGAAMPLALRQMALQGRFGMPELVDNAPISSNDDAPRPLRALNAGEDEIVIPMPLWAQMGRGRLSATEQIMASPRAPRGYAPPLGSYQLVATPGAPLDYSGGRSDAVQLSGPTSLELAITSPMNRGVHATSPSGRHLLARVALDANGSGGRPMAGALNSALQMSNQVSARTLPGRPSLDTSSASSVGSGSGNSDLDTGTLVTGPSKSGLSSGAQSQLDVSEGEMSRASSTAVSTSSSSTPKSGSGPSSRSRRSGMAPGMWSGASRFSTPGYQPWNYAANRPNTPVTHGSVNLSGLDRSSWPSLPTSLRFRYAGAPLWWSGSTSRGGSSAASSAASIWRSILVAGPTWGAPAEQRDASGGMDANREANADLMSSLSRKFDALTAASLVTGGAAAGAASGKGAESLYVAMNQSGAAGVASKSAVQRAKADALEMSIVAAIPAAPPPLESSGSSATGGDAPHARAKGHHAEQHGHGHKEGGDSVSHSKIEGSVDAIAQRIYHRIRRRIQNDRERFGG